MKPLQYIKKWEKYPEVKKVYLEYYKTYRALNKLKIKDLRLIGNAAGLNMDYYTYKSIIIKALLIKLYSGSPVQPDFVDCFR